MTVIRVATICPRMALASPQRNMRTLRHWAQKAANQDADLAVFPEVFITGYAERFMVDAGSVDPAQLLAMAEPVPGPLTDELVDLSRRLNIYLCAGLLERDGEARFNTQLMIDPAKGLLGRYRKVQIGPGEQWLCKGGTEWPVFDVRGVPTGVLLCRDKSHPEAARILALEGAQLLLVPHSCTVPPGMEFTTWSLKLCVARAMENGCYVLVNNNIYDCPTTGERAQAGYNFAIDPYGEVIHCDDGPADTEKMAVIEVDTNKVAERRQWEGPGFNLWSRRPETYHRLVDVHRDPCYESRTQRVGE